MKRTLVMLLIAVSLLTFTTGVFADPSYAGDEPYSVDPITTTSGTTTS